MLVWERGEAECEQAADGASDRLRSQTQKTLRPARLGPDMCCFQRFLLGLFASCSVQLKVASEAAALCRAAGSHSYIQP
eukprot:452590-Rhodomonas_salina.2